MSDVRFLKNWNNKLNNKYFITIRLFTKKKNQYYVNQLLNFDDIRVLLGKNDELYCLAKLIEIEKIFLKNIPEWLCYIDSGLNKKEFIKLLTNICQNKKEWRGLNTKLLILCYKRVDRYVEI